MLPILPLLSLFALSLGGSLLLTPLARALARRWGLVDCPDGRRKLHGGAVPVSGGLAILAASVGVLALAAVVPGPLADVLAAKATGLVGLLLGGLTICAVGVADDFHWLRGRHKVLGQVVAVALVLAFGVRIESVRLFDWHLELGLLAVPFTVFWLLGAINALNLLDGMDGLLGSVAGIITLALGGMALLQRDVATAAVAVALGGAVLGFLRYNFPPASIFLGDCGSMMIGLVVGALAIQSSLKGPATVALAAPTALLIIPIFDTAAAIVRRKLTGRSVYCTDRGHLHHCLLRRGLSIRLALLVVSALCLVPVVGVLASVAWSNEALALVSAAAVIATLMLTRLFGHAELMLLHRRIVAVVASFLARPRGEARQDAVHLQGSADWGEFWSRLTECAARLDLRSLSLDVNAPAIQEGYNAVWSRGAGHDDAQDGEGLWRAEIPLRACGQTVGRVEVTGVSDGECVSSKIGAVAALVAEIEEAVCGLVVRRDAAPYRPAGHPHRNGALERASTT
ncbi:MAG TPA: MraY family glycosyltransferase [Gemmataceae bacterium]|nr:MraY family glycosyltransferase [Gemmataceae bacterium]